MILPLFLVSVVANAPSPAPTPLKVITHVHASAVCTSLHDLVMPAARITKETQPLFHAVEQNVEKIHSVIKELGPGAGSGHDTAGAIFLDRLTKLPIANAEWKATQILVKLYEIDKILAASYAKFPQGTNRNVDSLRQRIQNMVDLQRAYANALRAGPAMVLDNQFPNALDSSNFGGGQTADPSLSDNPGPVNPDQDPAVSGYVPARPLVAKDLRTVPASSLARDLFTEESALVPAALAAVRDCDAPEP